MILTILRNLKPANRDGRQTGKTFAAAFLVFLSACQTPLSDLDEGPARLGKDNKKQSPTEENPPPLNLKGGVEIVLTGVEGGSNPSVTSIDSDQDGFADGLDIDGDGTPDWLFTSSGPEDSPLPAGALAGLDMDGDNQTDLYVYSGTANSFIFTNTDGQVQEFTTDEQGQPNGTTNSGQSISGIDGGSDEEPPVLNLTWPTAGEILAGTITISLSATDNGLLQRADLFLDGNPLAQLSAPTGNVFEYSWDTTALSDGAHTLTVSVSDAWGNQSEKTVEIYTANSSTASDTTPPEITWLSPLDGSYVNNTVTLSLNASDNIAISSVEFHVDNSLVGTVTSPPYQFDWDTTSLSDGDYPVKAIARDPSGNNVEAELTGLQVHNTAPSLSVASAPVASGGEIGGNVEFTATTSTSLGSYLRVDYYRNGVLTASKTSAPYTFNWNALTESQGSVHEHRFVATDSLGNSREESLNLTVDNSGLGSPPVADPGTTLVVSQGEAVELDGSASSDPDGYLLNWQWNETSGDGANQTGPKPDFSAPSKITTLVYQLVVTDNHSNQSSPATVRVLVVRDKNQALFVDPDNGNDSNSGTWDQPLQTLTEAININSGEDIYVMKPTSGRIDTTSGTLNLPAGISLYGGYIANWERDEENLPTPLDGAATALQISSVDGNIVLSGLDIQAANPATSDVPSFGLRVQGGSGNLTIENSQIRAGSLPLTGVTNPASSYGVYAFSFGGLTVQQSSINGGRGGQGSDGNNGADGSDGLDGSPGDDGDCDADAPGDGGAGGVNSGDNSLNGFNGGNGGFQDSYPGLDGDGPCGGSGGGYGDPGGDGGDATCGGSHGGAGDDASGAGDSLGSFSNGLYTISSGNDGNPGTDGTPGSGGGGGGPQDCGFCIEGCGNGGGGGGAAGQGGRAGEAGTGGGASIGLAAISLGNLTITNSEITSISGGQAGLAGHGGLAGNGGSGAAGSTHCSSEIGEGGDGSSGGNGGPGGDGSGGGGGPSLALTMDGVSSANITASTLTAGSGGDGGDSRNAPAGDGGHSYGIYKISGGNPTLSGNTIQPGTAGSGGSASGTGSDGANGTAAANNF